MKKIINISLITLKGGLRSKLLITLSILSLLVFIVIIPSFASFSMRQPREVATSLCLSTISFVLLILMVFLTITVVYKDIDSKITYFVLAQPISREQYWLGKFIGIIVILFFSWMLLTLFSIITLLLANSLYQMDLQIKWSIYFLASFMEFIKNFILAAIGLLFCSFSTNMFLPLFGIISVYIAGNVIQFIYDYVNSAYAERLPLITVFVSKLAYYVLPNLTAFDMKFNAIYNLRFQAHEIIFTVAYGLLYCIIAISLAILIFRRRQMV